MSAPMPPQLFVDRVRARGIRVVEMTVNGINWKNNNRNSKGPWDNVHGIVEHHTGSDTTDPNGYARFLFLGSSALIGPLCQFSTAPDGTLYMIGWGRCNHAGGGDPIVRDMVINDQIPYDREVHPTKGNLDGVDGNREYYGNEIMYSGGHPMTAAQLNTSTIVDKVICEYHGWGGNSIIAHREWSKDKPDPGYQNMATKRQAVQNNPPPPPPPPVKDWFDMASVDDLANVVRGNTQADVLVFVRKGFDGAVWLSNLITRRWIVDGYDFNSCKVNMEKAGIEDTKVYDVDNLNYFGVAVGPTPASGADGNTPKPAATK